MAANNSSALGRAILPPPHMAENVSPQALEFPSHYMWAHCQGCGTVWHYDFVLPASLALVAGGVERECCPGCGQGAAYQRLCGEETRKEAAARRATDKPE